MSTISEIRKIAQIENYVLAIKKVADMFAGHFLVIPECIQQRFSVDKCWEKIVIRSFTAIMKQRVWLWLI